MDGKQLENSQTVRNEKEKVKEINIKALYAVIRKKLWLIMLITLAFTVLAGLYNSRPETPVYSASTRMIVVANAEMMGTLRIMFREPVVLDQVIERLELNRSVGQLRSQIRVDSVEGSLVTVVSVIDGDPGLAAEIANTVVSVYRQVAAETLGVSGVKLLTEAAANPDSINVKSNTVVYAGFLAGLVLSIGLIFFLDSLNDSIRSEREIEELLGLTMLGQVSRMKKRDYARKSKKQKSVIARGETIGS
ncbi:YveK family protein [Paenibacillus harenae]|uniref:YveK family protein n=1 Tax=Paenibacillus harenae TaxID=306543 RepID=UPI000419BEAE|nr:Wzz/FepE/Etk N-terminal domain-containing protein [Paenibacillus harenae]